jgi:hypothetical protein
MITTTLNRIRNHNPCRDGWQKLLEGLGKTAPDDEPLPFARILEINGLDDALWCCRAEPQYAREWRLYAVWCARQVQHLMTDPRSIAAIDAAERHANGLETADELAAACAAAWDASAAARAARTAASDEWDAAWAAARAAARAAQWSAASDEWNAAWDAARTAAWAASDAARTAAWAASDAAWAAQSAEFLRLVTTTAT